MTKKLSKLVGELSGIIMDSGKVADLQTKIALTIWNTYFLFALAVFILAPVILGVTFIWAGYSISIQVLGLVPGVICFTGGILLNVFIIFLGAQHELYDNVTSSILKILYGKGDS